MLDGLLLVMELVSYELVSAALVDDERSLEALDSRSVSCSRNGFAQSILKPDGLKFIVVWARLLPGRW